MVIIFLSNALHTLSKRSSKFCIYVYNKRLYNIFSLPVGVDGTLVVCVGRGEVAKTKINS